MTEAGAFVANHSSWIDIVALQRAAAPFLVSKAEVRGWPGIGLIGRAIGTMFIDRRPAAAKAQEAELRVRLARGDQMAIFRRAPPPTGRGCCRSSPRSSRCSSLRVFRSAGGAAGDDPLPAAPRPAGDALRLVGRDGFRRAPARHARALDRWHGRADLPPAAVCRLPRGPEGACPRGRECRARRCSTGAEPLRPGEVVEDRAIRPSVAVAEADELGERRAHASSSAILRSISARCPSASRLTSALARPGPRRARAARGTPDREPSDAPGRGTRACEVRSQKLAVAVSAAVGPDQADLLVVADRLRGQPARSATSPMFMDAPPLPAQYKRFQLAGRSSGGPAP